MTELPKPRAETTEQFLAQSGPELAALCTACGACFDACPMVDHVDLRGADPKIGDERPAQPCERREPHRRRRSPGSAPARKSGLCVSACPQKAAGLDAMLLVRIAKQHAINETRQLPAK